MPGPVQEKLAEPGIGNHRAGGVVDIARPSTRPGGGQRGLNCALNGFMHLFILRRRFT
jgi:hypothetical protein